MVWGNNQELWRYSKLSNRCMNANRQEFSLAPYAAVMPSYLNEGRIIPSFSIWSNSCQAIARHSGGNRLVLAVTGGPVVVVW